MTKVLNTIRSFLSMRRYGKAARLIQFCLVIGAVLGGLNIVFAPPLERAYHFSPVYLDRNGEWLSAYSNQKGRWRLGAPLSEIDPKFIDQVIAIEDKRFYRHSGVDLIAVIRAAKSWTASGEVVSGASTITMQLARMLNPRPRTLGNKIIQAVQAVQIEMRLSKREILSLYLGHTPYGGNLEGVKSASLAYFDKPPLYLTQSEIALLIALPQAPETRRPDRHTDNAKIARNAILDRLESASVISAQSGREAREDNIQSKRFGFETQAWLSGRKHIRAATDKNRADTQPDIIPNRYQQYWSSLDKSIQITSQKLLHDYTDSRQFNAAVLIVENKTGKVRAHIGSAGRDRPGGWIDMTQALRSPGSTLKPFIYGMAFDDGISTAGSFILDAPTRFGSYQPQNFNTRYYGPVRVHEALAHSLNVPAVLALDKIGSRRFEAALAAGGSKILGNFDHRSGLALALGGIGMRVEDIAILYRSLANEGAVSPLIWAENSKTSANNKKTSARLLQVESARSITKILKQAPSPSGRVPHWLSENSHDIAYKTGTSYGFRDAWAAGYSEAWTVIVWVGRPDGAPRVGQTGRIAAAPLLFDLFSNLPANGLGPSDIFKGTTDLDDNLQFASKIKNVHPPQIGNHTYQKMDQASRSLQNFGGHFQTKPLILFPPDAAEILVQKFGENSRGLVLSARQNSPVQNITKQTITTRSQSVGLTWFVDGQPIPKDGLSGKTIWRPSIQGFYSLEVIDDMGRSARSNVSVRSSFDP